MKSILFSVSAFGLLSFSVMANDSIYGGYNPASRCHNPAGLENPIGVRKAVCKKMLTGEGIFGCIKPGLHKHQLCGVKEEIIIVQEQEPTKGKPLAGETQGQAPGKIPTQGEPPVGYCESMPELTDDLDASLIDPTINYPRGNNQYLRNLTIGEYRAACEDLAAKHRL